MGFVFALDIIERVIFHYHLHRRTANVKLIFWMNIFFLNKKSILAFAIFVACCGHTSVTRILNRQVSRRSFHFHTFSIYIIRVNLFHLLHPSCHHKYSFISVVCHISLWCRQLISFCPCAPSRKPSWARGGNLGSAGFPSFGRRENLNRGWGIDRGIIVKIALLRENSYVKSKE